MDKVFIRELEVEGVIGVHAWEQRLPRTLRVDLELGIDARQAASSDQVRDAVDYQAVADFVAQMAGERRVALLETLAETLARGLFERFPVLTLRLAIDKPGAVAGAKRVGVEIERRREDYASCAR